LIPTRSSVNSSTSYNLTSAVQTQSVTEEADAGIPDKVDSPSFNNASSSKALALIHQQQTSSSGINQQSGDFKGAGTSTSPTSTISVGSTQQACNLVVGKPKKSLTQFSDDEDNDDLDDDIIEDSDEELDLNTHSNRSSGSERQKSSSAGMSRPPSLHRVSFSENIATAFGGDSMMKESVQDVVAKPTLVSPRLLSDSASVPPSKLSVITPSVTGEPQTVPPNTQSTARSSSSSQPSPSSTSSTPIPSPASTTSSSKNSIGFLIPPLLILLLPT
jgi:hypothetical protein